MLRLVEVGAPICFISVGERFTIKVSELGNRVLSSDTAAWFKGFLGQMGGLVAVIALGVLCYLLAKVGAKWEGEEAGKDDDATPAAAPATSWRPRPRGPRP